MLLHELPIGHPATSVLCWPEGIQQRELQGGKIPRIPMTCIATLVPEAANIPPMH